MHRAVRTAVADSRTDSPRTSWGETVLNSCVTRYGDDSSIVINRTDLQVNERTASVASRVQEPARTLLIQSMEVLRKRAVRKRALSIAGTVAVVLIGGTSAVYAIAISGFHETGPRFTMMHPTLGDPILASSVVVEPHGGSVVMTDPRSDT